MRTKRCRLLAVSAVAVLALPIAAAGRCLADDNGGNIRFGPDGYLYARQLHKTT